MRVWLFQANEPMPNVHEGQRLFRMGLIAEELRKAGHDITWFSNTFDHFQKKQLYNKDTIVEVDEKYRINLIWSPSYKKNISVRRIINHKYMAMKFRKMASKLDKPDIIYTSFPTIEFAEEAIKYGKKNNVPVIVDIRDLWPDIFNHNLSKLKRIVAFPYIELMQYKTKKIMKNAFAINGISPDIVEWGLKKGGRAKTDYDKYFYMGYDKQVKNNEEKVELEKDKFNLCFFGTLNNQFRFNKIIKLAELLKEDNVNIYVCGLGEQYEYIKNQNMTNIKLLGWMNKQQLQYILKNSQMGLAPYKSTFDFQMGVSNKFAEYLSYGLPIVLTSGGYMGKIIDENDCGINTEDEETIVNYIRKIKVDEELYKKISNNALDLYNKEFVAETIYKELVKYLENIYKKESN